MKAPEIPVSWGEVIDKITILEIKTVRLKNAAARANVGRELSLLREKVHPQIAARADIQALVAGLKAVNEALWDIENLIRDKESKAEFGADFVTLARSVYKRNDERAAIKNDINRLLGSDIIEEKCYQPAP